MDVQKRSTVHCQDQYIASFVFNIAGNKNRDHSESATVYSNVRLLVYRCIHGASKEHMGHQKVYLTFHSDPKFIITKLSTLGNHSWATVYNINNFFLKYR